MPLIVDRLGEQVAPAAARGDPLLELLDLRSSALASASSLSDARRDLERPRLEPLARARQLVLEPAQVLQRARAGDRLDAAHALRPRRPPSTILNRPMSPARRTCVPPQNSIDSPPMRRPRARCRRTSRRTSPPRRAARASLDGQHLDRASPGSCRISALTRSSTRRRCSSVIGEKCVKSKRSRSGATSEPFCDTCAAQHLLEREVQEVRSPSGCARIRSRRSSSTSNATRSPTAIAPSVTSPIMHVDVARRLARVVGCATAAARRLHRARVADLAAATRRRTASGRTRARPSPPPRRGSHARAARRGSRGPRRRRPCRRPS